MRGPRLVQIYGSGTSDKKPAPPVKAEAGYAAITLENTVTRDVLESIGGIKDTIRPLASSLTSHEMRPYDVHVDYRQTLSQV